MTSPSLPRAHPPSPSCANCIAANRSCEAYCGTEEGHRGRGSRREAQHPGKRQARTLQRAAGRSRASGRKGDGHTDDGGIPAAAIMKYKVLTNSNYSACIPGLALAGANAYWLWTEHWEHWSHMPPLEERTEYPYQNIRTKNFPWGNGDKTLL